MPDPITVGMALKGVTFGGKIAGQVARLVNRRTDEFIKQRDEMHREWTAETAARVSQLTDDAREAFLLLGEAVEEHDKKLEELLQTPEAEVLAALYGEAAYREALEERRKMLQHAAASIVDLNVSIAEKCRAEKVLRDLDPSDVIELDRLERVAGTVERVSEGHGLYHFEEDRHRHSVLLASQSADALMSSGCVRVLGDKVGGNTAVVTSRGRVILHLLRSYVATRRVTAPGREFVPGERGSEFAFALLGQKFRDRIIGTAMRARTARHDLFKPVHLRSYRVQYDFPKPQVAGKERGDQPLTEPKADANSRLHIWPCSAEDLQNLRASVPEGLSVGGSSDAAAGYATAQIDGPFDVMRWLADEVDAWWT